VSLLVERRHDDAHGAAGGPRRCDTHDHAIRLVVPHLWWGATSSRSCRLEGSISPRQGAPLGGIGYAGLAYAHYSMNRYRSRPRSLCSSMRSVYHRVGAGKHRRHVRTRRWGRAKVHVTGLGRQRPSCCRRIDQRTFTCSVDHEQGPQACSAAPSTKPLAARGSLRRSCREELPTPCVGRSGGCSVRPGASWGGGWQSDALSVSTTHFGPFSPGTEARLYT
jgi:hypothetical protein